MDEQTQQPVAPVVDKADAEKNKGMAILAYFIFFIPLLAAKDSKFAMYHANQGLMLLLTSIGVSIVLGIIPILGWFLALFWPLVVLVLLVMGVINASKGEMKPLPVIGGYTILK